MDRREYDALFTRAAKQAQRILGDRVRAEDIASEAIGRLLSGSRRESFTLIVHGLTVDAYRRLQKETPFASFNEDLSPFWQGQPLSYEQVEFRHDFDRAVRALGEDDRHAFLLTAVRGLSTREAADVLHIDQSTVSRRAERARSEIKEALSA